METKIELTEEIKKLIKMNISSEDFRYLPGEFGSIDGKYQFIIDWDKVTDRDIKVITENLKLIKERSEARKNRNEILEGDYLRMPDGSISRITYCWPDSAQDGGGSGSFYLNGSGSASYSGSLNSSKTFEKITPTDETKPALFWIFSRGWSGANRGFYFYIDVRVWEIKSMLKTAYVKFEDHDLNYHTNVNGSLSDSEIKAYFVGKFFNLGTDSDNMQKCTDCAVYY